MATTEGSCQCASPKIESDFLTYRHDTGFLNEHILRKFNLIARTWMLRFETEGEGSRNQSSTLGSPQITPRSIKNSKKIDYQKGSNRAYETFNSASLDVDFKFKSGIDHEDYSYNESSEQVFLELLINNHIYQPPPTNPKKTKNSVLESPCVATPIDFQATGAYIVMAKGTSRRNNASKNNKKGKQHSNNPDKHKKNQSKDCCDEDDSSEDLHENSDKKDDDKQNEKRKDDVGNENENDAKMKKKRKKRKSKQEKSENGEGKMLEKRVNEDERKQKGDKNKNHNQKKLYPIAKFKETDEKQIYSFSDESEVLESSNEFEDTDKDENSHSKKKNVDIELSGELPSSVALETNMTNDSVLDFSGDKYADTGEKEKEEKRKVQENQKPMIQQEGITPENIEKFPLEGADLALFQIPGAFNPDCLDHKASSCISEIDDTGSILCVDPIDSKVKNDYVADNLTGRQEVVRPYDELAQITSFTSLNSTSYTENVLMQVVSDKSYFGNNDSSGSNGKNENVHQNPTPCTRSSPNKVDEFKNTSRNLTEVLGGTSSFDSEDAREIDFDDYVKSTSNVSIDQNNTEIRALDVNFDKGETKRSVNSEKVAAGLNLKPVKLIKENKKASTQGKGKKNNTRVAQRTELTVKDEVGEQIKADESDENKKIKEFGLNAEVESKAIATQSSELRAGKQTKADTTAHKIAFKMDTKKNPEKILPAKHLEDKIAPCPSADNQEYAFKHESEGFAENLNENSSDQIAIPVIFDESRVQLEAIQEKSLSLEPAIATAKLEIISDVQLDEGKNNVIVNTVRSPEESCLRSNLTSLDNCSMPIVGVSKSLQVKDFSKSKQKEKEAKRVEQQGNVANRLKTFEAHQKDVAPLSPHSKVSEKLAPHNTLSKIDFVIIEPSAKTSAESEDMTVMFPKGKVKDIRTNCDKKFEEKQSNKLEKKENKLKKKMEKGSNPEIVEYLIKSKEIQDEYRQCKDHAESGEREELDKPLEPIGPEESMELEESVEPGESEDDGGIVMENSALILSEVHRNLPLFFSDPIPEIKMIKKERPRTNRNVSSWGVLGVAPRGNVKRIARSKPGDKKKPKMLLMKHSTPIKNPVKKDFPKASPHRRADKADRPPISRAMSSIFVPPTRSKSASERHSSDTRKPSSQRRYTSEEAVICSSSNGLLDNKPEISLKAAKLLGVSPSPFVRHDRKTKITSAEDEDILFESAKEIHTGPKKQGQRHRTKDDNDLIIDSSRPSESIIKRPVTTKKKRFGRILSGLISARPRPTTKHRSTILDDSSRSLRREDRKIKQSIRGTVKVRMSGGLTDESQKVRIPAYRKETAEGEAAELAHEDRRAKRAKGKAAEDAAERKVSKEAAQREAAEFAQDARTARRAKRKAAEEAAEREAAVLAQEARRARKARRAKRKAAEEATERKATEEATERKATEEAAKLAQKARRAERKTAENVRRADSDRQERYRRKEEEAEGRRREDKDARRVARRSQTAKVKSEKRDAESVEVGHAERRRANRERLSTDDRLEVECCLGEAEKYNLVSQIPESDERRLRRHEKRGSIGAAARNARLIRPESGYHDEYYTTSKSQVKCVLNEQSSGRYKTSQTHSVTDACDQEKSSEPLLPSSPLALISVEQATVMEEKDYRETRKSRPSRLHETEEERDDRRSKRDSRRLKKNLIPEELDKERDERRRKRDSRRLKENLASNETNRLEQRSSRPNSTCMDSRAPSAQGGFLCRWKRKVGV